MVVNLHKTQYKKINKTYFKLFCKKKNRLKLTKVLYLYSE